MISAQVSNSPIEIGLLEISPQDKAVLEFYFNSQGAELYKQVEAESAEAFLFDYEISESKALWEKLNQETNKPGIAISKSEVNLPNTVWLQAPLSPDALSQAADQISTFIQTSDSEKPNSLQELDTNITQPEEELSLELVPQDSTNTDEADQSSSSSPEIVNVKAGITTEYANQGSDSKDEPDAIDSLLDSLNSDIQARAELDASKNESAQLSELEPILDAKIAETTESELEVSQNSEIDSLLTSLDDNETDHIEVITEERIDPIEAADEISLADQNDEPKLFTEEIIDTSDALSESKESNDEKLDTSDDIETSSLDELESIGSKPIFDDSSDAKNQDTGSDLQAMLDEIQLEMEDSGSVPIKNLDGVPDTSSRDAHHHEHENINTQERWELLCGDINSIKNAAGIKKNAYKLKDHLLSYLLDTVKKAQKTNQGMRIKYDDILLLIDPELDTIYSDTSLYSDEYAHTCFEHIDHSFVKVHSLDLSESRMMHKKIELEPENAYSIEAFLWTSILLTSRGRLLKHTNTNTIVGLKKWPTLKALEPFPHVLEIAVEFSKEESNLLEIPAKLEIPQCYAFAFYNAAVCLDKLDVDSDVLDKNNIKKVSFGFKKKDKAENNKSKGNFFSRFLKKK